MSVFTEFEQVTPLDRAGRRALWIRVDPPEGGSSHECGGSVIELRAGREGDDAQVTLRAGDTVTPETIRALAKVMWTAKSGLLMDGRDKPRWQPERP